MNKNKVIKTLEELPDEFSIEELIDRLLFIDKIEQGLKDVEEEKTLTLEEAKARMKAKWQK